MLPGSGSSGRYSSQNGSTNVLLLVGVGRLRVLTTYIWQEKDFFKPVAKNDERGFFFQKKCHKNDNSLQK